MEAYTDKNHFSISSVGCLEDKRTRRIEDLCALEVGDWLCSWSGWDGSDTLSYYKIAQIDITPKKGFRIVIIGGRWGKSGLYEDNVRINLTARQSGADSNYFVLENKAANKSFHEYVRAWDIGLPLSTECAS